MYLNPIKKIIQIYKYCTNTYRARCTVGSKRTEDTSQNWCDLRWRTVCKNGSEFQNRCSIRQKRVRRLETISCRLYVVDRKICNSLWCDWMVRKILCKNISSQLCKEGQICDRKKEGPGKHFCLPPQFPHTIIFPESSDSHGWHTGFYCVYMILVVGFAEQGQWAER